MDHDAKLATILEATQVDGGALLNVSRRGLIQRKSALEKELQLLTAVLDLLRAIEHQSATAPSASPS
jgi:hypothetical protein